MSAYPIICLAGPTGSGKTALGLLLAQELNGEIINADSRQTYTDFPIVTAQPDEKERKAAPHHLYAFLDSGEKLDACSWSKLACKKILDLHSRGKTPILVGGSGFYFQTLLAPLPSIPDINPEISAFYAEKIRLQGSQTLYEVLRIIDPVYAAKIHPNDRQRIQRALEVYSGTGKSFSWWHDSARPKPLCAGPLFVLNYPLSELAPRLKRRQEQMRKNGALAEIINAWKKCPDKSAPGWSGIGCRESLDYLMGRLSWQEWQHSWFANTRAYAKRQLTWFRGAKDAILLKPEDARAILYHPALEQFKNPSID